MKCQNLNFIFDAFEFPENLSDFVSGRDFSPSEDYPDWLEDINAMYAEDDVLYINNMPMHPGAVVVWNTKLNEVQDIFDSKEEFEEVYFSPEERKGSYEYV